MLPTDSVVLLMQANDIRRRFGRSVSFYKIAVEVLSYCGVVRRAILSIKTKKKNKKKSHLDDAQAITSKAKIVCTFSCTAVTKIKCLFAMIRRSGICIWDRL
jgi:hypothetical protein